VDLPLTPLVHNILVEVHISYWHQILMRIVVPMHRGLPAPLIPILDERLVPVRLNIFSFEFVAYRF
jgi:hypothetical protein